ncbi:MAG TPA: type II toxin-antitoxin system death-on-curing family toxin [Caulobacteraceae bacterium]|nr:type II toxin-antitoxin system death-on-curing family toxin [Caulobacteraceae bacterium]
MAEPRWLSRQALLVLHARTLGLHGGRSGVRDEGLLDSALARPVNRFLYDDIDDLAELAAVYAMALSANHPFVDGNKRVAFLALGLFLRVNGLELTADPADAARVMFAVAAGTLDQSALTAWIRTHARSGSTPPPRGAA